MRVLADELRSEIMSRLDNLQEQFDQPALTKKQANATAALKQNVSFKYIELYLNFLLLLIFF
jgi:hypothetical protein